MVKFTVAIEETVVEEFDIEANSEEEALSIAQNKYKNGELVLSSGEVQAKQVAIVKPGSETSEWLEF